LGSIHRIPDFVYGRRPQQGIAQGTPVHHDAWNNYVQSDKLPDLRQGIPVYHKYRSIAAPTGEFVIPGEKDPSIILCDSQ
jgi:hypothetical protein